jgi:drug/metabolite transporter (DMT)-like permease
MGSFLVILSAFGFATLGLFGKFAYEAGFGRNEALFWRFGLSLPLLSLLLAVTRSFPTRAKPFLLAVLLGMIGIGVESSVFFVTLQHLGAALTGIFLYLYPAFVALISHFFLRERLTKGKWAGVALALAGSVLTAGVIGGAADGMVSPLEDPVGLLFGVITGGWYALYILAGDRLTRNENPLTMSAGVTLGSFISFACLTLGGVIGGESFHGVSGSKDWISVGGLALFATVLPFTTLYAGMKRTGAVKASLLSTLELVFTVILASVFLGEKLTLWQGVGALLILISVLLASLLR